MIFIAWYIYEQCMQLVDFMQPHDLCELLFLSVCCWVVRHSQLKFTCFRAIRNTIYYFNQRTKILYFS